MLHAAIVVASRHVDMTVRVAQGCKLSQEPLFKAFGDKIAKTVVAALDIVTQAFRCTLLSHRTARTLLKLH